MLNTPRPPRPCALVWTLALAPAALLGAAPAVGQIVQDIQFEGQATFPTGTQFDGTEVGGLSGITYNPATGLYYSVSDDRSSAARFYTLDIAVSDAGPTVTFLDSTQLRQPDGQPFAANSLDPEGIAVTAAGTLFISSEGDADPPPLFDPFVNEFNLSGQQIRALPVPGRFLPTTGNTGIRNNLAFESLTISPGQTRLFTATENALKQDGPPATTAGGSPSRVLRYDLPSGQPAAEFVYVTDPVAEPPAPAGSFATNGLVDLIALNDTTLLALERSFSTGAGNTIKLFEISTAGATDVSNLESLPADLAGITVIQKTLLLNLDEINTPLDNVEGLTFGPTLADGRRTLVLVSDNNFSPTQFTQFLAFTVTVPEPASLAAVCAGGLALLARRRGR